MTVEGIAGRIVSGHLNVAPKALAVRLAMTLLETATDEIANVPVSAPDGTVAVPGTVTYAGVSEVRVTENPAGGAAALSVRVPVIVPPP